MPLLAQYFVSLNQTPYVDWVGIAACPYKGPKQSDMSCRKYYEQNKITYVPSDPNNVPYFRKFERELIKHCADFRMLNSCFIKFLLLDSSSKLTCIDIEHYLSTGGKQHNHNHSNIKKKEFVRVDEDEVFAGRILQKNYLEFVNPPLSKPLSQ